MSWVPIPLPCDFTLANIPFGIFQSIPTLSPRPAIAIGAKILDLHAFTLGNGFSHLLKFQPQLSVFTHPSLCHSLNAFAALGPHMCGTVRAYLQEVLTAGGKFSDVLENHHALQALVLRPRDTVEMCLPFQIGDYTDFYAGRVHAFNVGCLFRGPENALQKNYEQLPVGYHGRASSVVVSGTPVRRPWGQTAPGVFEPCRKLDLELELAAFVAMENGLGEPVSTADARGSIFGYVLMNDWSGVFCISGSSWHLRGWGLLIDGGAM